MKGLLLKDILLLTDRRKILIFVAMLALFTFNLQSLPYLSVILLPFLLITIILSTLQMDDVDNNGRFLFSLPVSRKTYVKEKYVLAFISGIISLLLATIIILLSFTLQANQINWQMFGLFLSLGLGFMTVYLGISLPLQLKFQGAKNQGIVIMGTMLIMFLLITALQKIPMEWLTDNRNCFQTILTNPWLLFIIVFITCAGLLIFSYLVSIKIVSRKNF